MDEIAASQQDPFSPRSSPSGRGSHGALLGGRRLVALEDWQRSRSSGYGSRLSSWRSRCFCLATPALGAGGCRAWPPSALPKRASCFVA